MLTADEASSLYTKLCVFASKEEPELLKGLYMPHCDYVRDRKTNSATQYVFAVSPRKLAQMLDDLSIEWSLEPLLDQASISQEAGPLRSWLEENIGPGIVQQVDPDQGWLVINMAKLQALCGGEIQKRGRCR